MINTRIQGGASDIINCGCRLLLKGAFQPIGSTEPMNTRRLIYLGWALASLLLRA